MARHNWKIATDSPAYANGRVKMVIILLEIAPTSSLAKSKALVSGNVKEAMASMPMQQFATQAAEAVSQMSAAATVAAQLAAFFAGGQGTELNKFLKLLVGINPAVRWARSAEPSAPYRRAWAPGMM